MGFQLTPKAKKHEDSNCIRTEKALKIKFSGRRILGHQGPTCRDITDLSPGMSRTKTLCKVPFLLFAIPPACYRSLSGPSGPKCPRECPRKWGVFEGVSDGGVPGALRAPECPKSVLRVSPECPGHLFDTPRTLSGHCLDTPEPGARRAPGTPRRTPPIFGDTSGPKGPRDSCSRPAGSQSSVVVSAPGKWGRPRRGSSSF